MVVAYSVFAVWTQPPYNEKKNPFTPFFYNPQKHSIKPFEFSEQ